MAQTRLTLRDRILWLTVLRCLTVTLLLGSAIALNVNDVHSFSHPSYVGLTSVIIATYAFTACYALWLRKTERVALAGHVGLMFDALVAGAQILMTGGLESPFIFLILVVALYGGVMMGRPGGVAAASYTTLSLGLIVVVGHTGETVSWLYLWRPDWSSGSVLYRTMTLALSSYATGLLSGALAERLERTERELDVSQRDLRRLESFNQRVLEGLSDGVLVLEMGDRVVYANRASCRVLRRARDELEGASLEGLGVGRSEGAGARWERSVRLGGEERSLALSQAPFRDEEGRQRGMIVMLQDLTELRRAERALEQRERLSTLGRFAAKMAHEIRNPLTSICSGVEMLSDTVSEDDQVFIEIIGREIERLNGLLRDTLDYARPRALTKLVVPCEELIGETARLFHHDAGAQGVALELELEALTVRADPEAMRQVLWNLWRNGAEAMGGEGRLRTTARRSGDEVVIRIDDSGGGIDAASRETIFEPFFTTKEEGTGLGLATVHQLMTEQGGAIQLVDPDPLFGGAAFELRLPLVDVEAAGASTPIPRLEEAA